LLTFVFYTETIRQQHKAGKIMNAKESLFVCACMLALAVVTAVHNNNLPMQTPQATAAAQPAVIAMLVQ
jgi:hypothetical protein